MINFKKIRMKNILSYGNTFTEIDLDSFKSTLIVGKNGNGKSTIIEAMTFALYGKPYRKINKNQLINSTNKKELLVELEMNVDGNDYLIRRGIKPNKFEYFKNGELVAQDSKVAEYQAKLESDVLKMNFKSYSQIVVLGTASFTPFMELSTPERRAVVEDLIGLEVFTAMNERLKEMVKDNKNDIRDNAHSIELAEVKQKASDEKREIVESNADAKKESIMSKVKDIMSKIEQETAKQQNLSKVIEENKVSVDRLKDVEAKRTKWLGIKQQLISKIDHVSKDSEFFKHNDDCPTCRQAIEESHKLGIISDVDAKVSELEDGLKKLDQQIEQMDETINDLTPGLESFKKANSELESSKMSMSIHKDTLKGLKREMLALNEQVEEVVIEDFTSQIEDLKKQRKTLLKDKEILASSANLLKDGGIKAKVISKYVPFINTSINKYLSEFEFYADFVIDENFNETIRSRFRDEFSYFSFSEGEKARIDISLMLTWRELARKRNSVATNLVIFDEVFDGSTDTDGVESMKNILNNEDTNIIVISHKSETHEATFDRVYEAKKVQGFTDLRQITGE